MANWYVTPNGAGAKTGVDWNNAAQGTGGTTLRTFFNANVAAADTMYMLSGTYATSFFDPNTPAGTAQGGPKPHIMGVSDEALTPAVGDARPLVVAQYGWYLPNTVDVSNLRFTSNQAQMFTAGAYSTITNVKCTSGNMAEEYCMYGSGNVLFFNCEASIANGWCFVNGAFIGCFAHDCKYGFRQAGIIVNCVVKNCSNYGFNMGYAGIVANNTFYNCVYGLYGLISIWTVVNNIFHSCTHAIYGQSLQGRTNTQFKGNIFYNNGSNVTNGPFVVLDSTNQVNVDPKLVDPVNNDFSLQADSPAKNTGWGYEL